MKQRFLFIFLVTSAVMLTACTIAPTPTAPVTLPVSTEKPSVAQPTQPMQPTQPSQSAQHTQPVQPTQPEQPTQHTPQGLAIQSLYRDSFLDLDNGNTWLQYTPTDAFQKTVSALPDIRQIPADARTANVWHIASLDMDITLPEGFYVVRIDGIYLDSAGSFVTLQFVDQYVITDKEISAEQLTQDIVNFRSDALNHPDYILWSFSVFHKDYLPIESLFSSRLATQTDSGISNLILCGDYISRLGTCEWGCYSIFSETTDADGQDIVTIEYKWGPPVKDPHNASRLVSQEVWETSLIPFLQKAICAKGNGAAVLSPEEAFPPFIWSVTSQNWQHYFQEALSHLSQSPKQYSYHSIYLFYYSLIGAQMYTSTGWTLNAENDNTLRAAVYASLRAAGKEVPLEELYIFTRTRTDGRTMFIAAQADPSDGYRLTPLLVGQDLLGVSDYAFAQSYVKQYLR